MIRMTKYAGAFFLAALLSFPMVSFSQHEDEHHGEEEHADEHEEHGHNEQDEHDEHGHDEHEEEGHSDEVVLSEAAIQLYNVTTEQARIRKLTDSITVPSHVSYNTEAMAHIGTQVRGRAEEILVRLGDEVNRGDLLLVIDSPELGAVQSELLQRTAAVDAAQSGVEAANTSVDIARTAFDRAQELRDANGISVTAFIERQGALRQAEANAHRAQAELKVAESALLATKNQLRIFGITNDQIATLLQTGEVSTRYEIQAPIDGRVIEREVTPGEVVDPGEEALMVLANMEELWVLADVPERAISRVVPGASARVTLTHLDALPFTGTVTYISPHLDPRTRRASIRIVLPTDAEKVGTVSPGDVLKPGMFGEATVQLAASPGQEIIEMIAVPETAIQVVEGGPAVFVPVEGEPNTFAKRAIQTGPRVGQWVPVLSGLHEGESYVATKTFILKAELGKEGAGHGHAH